ncbi:MAG: type II toxin-antitoxin system VapC family toxin [Acidobacteriia bacterium]|nr:type II toxin-antitoxin system VapC family toxin [Terriglobia bacterium]
MRLMLDTHAFLWAVGLPSKLSPKAVDLIADDGNELFLSVASLWEIVLKKEAGKLHLPATADYFRAHLSVLGVRDLLPIQPAHIYRLNELPPVHRDPFDRLLAAQCLVEGLALVSADAMLREYGVEVVW